MAAPTLIASSVSATGDIGTSETTASFTFNSGDVFVVLGMTEDNAQTLGTPTATGLTFAAITPTSGVNPTNTGSSCKGYAWSATAAAGGSSTITSTGGAVGHFIVAYQYRGSDGVGACVTAVSTALTVNLTRTQANSAVATILGDWGAPADVTVASDPAGGTQDAAFQHSGRYSGYAFHWADEGATGTTAYGIGSFTASGSNITKLVVEIKGAAGGGAAVTPDIAMPPLTH